MCNIIVHALLKRRYRGIQGNSENTKHCCVFKSSCYLESKRSLLSSTLTALTPHVLLGIWWNEGWIADALSYHHSSAVIAFFAVKGHIEWVKDQVKKGSETTHFLFFTSSSLEFLFQTRTWLSSKLLSAKAQCSAKQAWGLFCARVFSRNMGSIVMQKDPWD